MTNDGGLCPLARRFSTRREWPEWGFPRSRDQGLRWGPYNEKEELNG